MKEDGARLIPILPGQKRPAILRWDVFNKRPPTEAEFASWLRFYANYGIGLAFGLDDVIGVDLDWTDPAIAARAWDITKDILGETPLVRIGRPPKRLALYRCEPGLVVDGKSVSTASRLFTRSGQCVSVRHPSGYGAAISLAGRHARDARAGGPAARHASKQVFALIDGLRATRSGNNGPTPCPQFAATRSPASPPTYCARFRTSRMRRPRPRLDPRRRAAWQKAQHHGRRRPRARHARLFQTAAIFTALDDVYYTLMEDLSVE